MATETPFPTSSAETQRPNVQSEAGMSEARISEAGVGQAAPQRSGDSVLADGAAGRPMHTDDLIGRIAQSAHETIDRLAETAAPHVNRLQENLSGDVLHQRADEMRVLRDEWAESLRVTVRENPLAAVGVALAVGVLVARLSR